MRRIHISLIMPILVALGGPINASGADIDGLTTRFDTLVDVYVRSERESVDVDALREEMLSLLNDLDAAGMDSLAVEVVTRTQSLYTRRGDLERARAVIARGIVIAERSQMKRARAVLTMNMAVTWAIAGDMEAFIAALTELLPIFETIEDHGAVGVTWFNMGVAYTKLGRFPEALSAIEQAMSAARRVNDRSRLGSAYAMATELNLTAGRLTEAAALVDSAVAITREVGRGVPLGAALTVQALVLEAQGDNAGALAAVDEAIVVREKIGDEVFVMMSRLQKGLLLLLSGRPAECQELVQAILPRLEAQGDAMQIHTAGELRCQALFDQGKYDEAESLLNAAIARFESNRAALAEAQSRAGFFGTGGEGYATLARIHYRRGNIDAAWEAVERGRGAVLARMNPDGESAQVPERASLQSLQAFLGKNDAALVEFSDPRMNPVLVFVVTEQSIEARELPFASELRSSARASIQLLAAGAGDADCLPLLVRLSTLVGVPELNTLPTNIVRLYLVPPAPLAGFPFEALPLVDAKTTLGDRFAISYASNATWIVTQDANAGMHGILAFADPETRMGGAEPGAVNSQFRTLAEQRLTRAREEVRVLAGDNTQTVVGIDATPDRFVSLSANGVGVIHFATHAVVNPYAPERSCLLLAGDNGVLEAAAVDTLKIRADLVTLSGCETSGGFAYIGEGTFGLARSFLAAGARSVVSSLWKVEDAAAARFMTVFYDELREGAPRDMALLAARQTLRAEGMSHRDRSAFILTGAGALPVSALAALGPGSEGQRGSRAALAGLAVLSLFLLVGAWLWRRVA